MEQISLQTFAERLISGGLDADINSLECDAEEQVAYHHPLKPATTAHQRSLGEYNLEAVKKLRELKAHLISGAAIVNPNTD